MSGYIPGGKSLHAIVKVDAADYDEYGKRVRLSLSVLPQERPNKKS